MVLAEKLAARASAREATAQVDCGKLGSVTVEALPVRELEGLLRGPDGPRAVFYAACRELQSAGEELRRAGQLYTPDQIMQFVSESEAQAAARAVLSLSGWDEDKVSEVRLSSVQETGQALRGANEEIRLPNVQTADREGAALPENRLSSVQTAEGEKERFGQVSRETGVNSSKNNKIFARTQALDDLSAEQVQNVVSNEADAPNLSADGWDPADGLHQITTEFPVGRDSALHEIKSESHRKKEASLHETESESSEKEGVCLHEIESDSFKRVHETESEYAERLARALLKGLQRAKWVRGG